MTNDTIQSNMAKNDQALKTSQDGQIASGKSSTKMKQIGPGPQAMAAQGYSVPGGKIDHEPAWNSVKNKTGGTNVTTAMS